MSAAHHPGVTALVLAAGQGTRMKSDLAKVLHPMAGRPLLAFVLDALEALGVGRTMVVVGHQRERVQEAFAERRVGWVAQVPQRGTGHAVMMAAPELEEFHGPLLVVCGDTPLLTPRTLEALLERHASTGAAATVLSMRLPEPRGYGRIVRDPAGALAAIVEERDATAEQRVLDEVNSGNYAFDYPALAAVLPRLGTGNRQGEYYLTDAIALLRERGRRVEALCAPEYRELLGVNTPEQLAEAERLYLARGAARPAGEEARERAAGAGEESR